ncbi:MAG: cell filamentation protein Fic [Rickettsiaceae bacterium]|jgi:hypothetical protein|nr:cell filamentation protein Fic [Rickettsiaceae bacterium]
MPKTNQETRENPQILIYQSEDGKIKFNVELQQETVWLNQEQMALLFGKTQSIIEHIQNIFNKVSLTKMWYVEISDTLLQTLQLKEKCKKLIQIL